MDKHTPGPWFADSKGYIWRRDPSELYGRGGTVAGEKPLAVADRGWYGEGVTGFPLEDNARLIAAAPDLFDALQMMLCAKDDDEEYEAIRAAQAAIDQARGAG